MGKELSARVVLYGAVDGSVRQIGKAISSLSSQATQAGYTYEQVGRPIRNVGKGILEASYTYEQGMNRIKGITNLANKDLNTIDEKLKEVALTSRFTPLDLAKSYGTLMMAGIDWQDGLKMQAGLVQYATAANLDLNDATEKLISNLYATGTPLDNVTRYTDIMSTVATNSKTDIIGLSDAVIRMGSVSRYFKDNDQLLTWLGMLGNLGFEGSEAGTYLRNVMLALAAPTDSAREVIESLGIAEESLTTAEIDQLQAAIDELNADGSIKSAQEGIKELGLQVYDSKGNMRPMIDVLKDLNGLTSDMSEKKRNAVLSKIFPKRTLAAATGMLGVLKEYDELYNKVAYDSEGAAKRQANAMDAGMVGVKYRLESAWQQLQLSIGDILGEDFINIADKLTDVTKALIEMPSETKAAWIGTLKSIAFTGPGLLIAGKGLGIIANMFKMLGSTAGAGILAGTAIITISSALAEMNEEAKRIDLKERFGNLEIDSEAYAQTLREKFRNMVPVAEILDDFDKQIQTLSSQYESSMRDLGNSLFDAVLGNKTLTEEDKQSLLGYVGDMTDYVFEQIKIKSSSNYSLIDSLFEGDEASEYKLLSDNVMNGLIEEARSAKAELENVLKLSFEDGLITTDEQTLINKTVGKLTDVQAKVAAELAKNELMANLRLSSESHDEMIKTYVSQRDKILNEQRLRAYIFAESIQGQDPVKSQAVRDQADKDYASQKAQMDRDVLAMETNILNETFGEFSTSDISGTTQAAKDNFKKEMKNLIDGGLIDQQTVLNSIATEYMKTGTIGQTNRDWLNRLINYGKITNPSADITTLLTPEMFEQNAAGEISNKDMLERIGRALTYGLQYGDFSQGQGESAIMPIYAGMGEQTALAVGKAWTNLPHETLPEEAGNQIKESLVAKATEAGTSGGTILGETFEKSAMESLPSVITWDLTLVPNVVQQEINAAVQSSPLGAAGPGRISNTRKNRFYAKGGRADEISIFGEAGPEWAIPEAHTQNTLDLLSSAAMASGFNADDVASNMEKNITFAPVINVTGDGGSEAIEKALNEAFLRFERILSRRDRDRERLSYS